MCLCKRGDIALLRLNTTLKIYFTTNAVIIAILLPLTE